jgi:tetratricopeptide (TPR) repeat protein
MVEFARQGTYRRAVRRRGGEHDEEPVDLPGIPDPGLALRGDRGAVEALQETAGNAATATLLAGPGAVVQRDPLAGLDEDDATSLNAILAEADRSEARALFEEGVARYRRHAYVEAGELFEQAAGLAPQAAQELQFDAARAYEMAARGRASGPGAGGGAGRRGAAPAGDEAQAQAREAAEAGSTAYASGDWAGAIAAFRRSMAAMPAPEMEWNMAMAFFRSGQHADALDHFRAYASSSGSAAAAPWIRRCERAASRGGQLSERDLAILGESDEESMNAVVAEAQRADAQADFEAGTDLFRQGAFGDAAERFTSANAALPDSPELAFDIAVANQRAGDYPAAIAGFKRYLGIGG